jgi:hypothetical protein
MVLVLKVIDGVVLMEMKEQLYLVLKEEMEVWKSSTILKGICLTSET